MIERNGYLFHQGTLQRGYLDLGCHFGEREGVAGAWFRTWAPHAAGLAVTGDFCAWAADAHPMTRISGGGLYECFVPGVERYQSYKFAVTTAAGKVLLKSDPYAFHSQTGLDNASKAYGLPQYAWRDGGYRDYRKRTHILEQPLNIYECAVGSWRRHPDGNPYSYRRFADEIVPYVKKMGYTHIELLGVAEYPYEGSWGYQVTGYYAPTSRFGTPEDFCYLVDACHTAGVGVIIDWVPGHFPKDAHGLAQFDGRPCYEYADPKKGEHKQWGTLVFDYGRTEVQSFLVSNAMYWLDIYHIDGLRVDAVASMLYLDYNRPSGEWSPNRNGGKEHLEAIALLKKLNEAVFAAFPDALMIAEESTSWSGVTRPTYAGGLGFNLKWNMGWMHDTLEYMQADPLFRRNMQHKLTFSFMYAYSENFVLALSHDEVVHGKKSLLDKMFGSYEDKFASLRTYLAYMTAHPGKKLLMMGGEFGQFSEWKYDAGLDWLLLDYPMHAKLKGFVAALNHFYLAHPSLWADDFRGEGFTCLSADDRDRNMLVTMRKSASDVPVYCVFNFAPVLQKDYPLPFPAGAYECALNSDAAEFGGVGVPLPAVLKSKKPRGKPPEVRCDVPPLAAVFFTPTHTPQGARHK
ncbi:MAG: 1,4-alpha-glucan branching protein GlgB [Clostridiales bacterium]|jgi:1,4-alpha-glucan branching enzyme|nr:1,4-alpha-glucan branching protein GlgB [Clostridiales bacterium]